MADDRFRDELRAYYAANGDIPPLAKLAEIWGFSSKSSASRIATTLVAEGFLVTAPGRRLRPGPQFSETVEPDAVDHAVSRWSEHYPEESSRGYDVTTRLLHLARSIEAGVGRASAREGVSYGELMVLDALYRLGPPHSITPTALRRHLLLSLAGVGKRVDRLHALGLVDRVPDDRDGRSLLVQLNAKGMALLERAVETDRQEAHIAWAIDLTPMERAFLIDILRRAQQRIDAASGVVNGDGDAASNLRNVG